MANTGRPLPLPFSRTATIHCEATESPFVRFVGFTGSELRAARTTKISFNRSFPIYVQYEKSRDNWPPSRKPRKLPIVQSPPLRSWHFTCRHLPPGQINPRKTKGVCGPARSPLSNDVSMACTTLRRCNSAEKRPNAQRSRRDNSKDL